MTLPPTTIRLTTEVVVSAPHLTTDAERIRLAVEVATRQGFRVISAEVVSPEPPAQGELPL